MHSQYIPAARRKDALYQRNYLKHELRHRCRNMVFYKTNILRIAVKVTIQGQHIVQILKMFFFIETIEVISSNNYLSFRGVKLILTR